ncbi:hypothetical protein NDU88_006208 [Pleurodeles waltl]|uniref:Uncharacterized protein n=1 Tax=Pleurodeles waltl TaxID=8319 RepID=A0AAV7PI58_PLEWA|nr:hypothetical protein NDU88_006208 [Pleurodeles waltl]
MTTRNFPLVNIGPCGFQEPMAMYAGGDASSGRGAEAPVMEGAASHMGLEAESTEGEGTSGTEGPRGAPRWGQEGRPLTATSLQKETPWRWRTPLCPPQQQVLTVVIAAAILGVAGVLADTPASAGPAARAPWRPGSSLSVESGAIRGSEEAKLYGFCSDHSPRPRLEGTVTRRRMMVVRGYEVGDAQESVAKKRDGEVPEGSPPIQCVTVIPVGRPIHCAGASETTEESGKERRPLAPVYRRPGGV